MGTVVFRVKKNKPNTWALKTKNAFGKKDIGNGSFVDKEIGYFPGSDSPFVEDNKDKKQGSIDEFVKSDESGFAELRVNESNRSLITYLKTHPWFNIHFEIFDSNEEAQRKLQAYDKTETALEFLRGKQDSEVVAIGLLVIGAHAINMGSTNVLKELKEIAFSTPQRILDVTSNVDFRTLLIGATAFVKGIVTTNDTKTAVIWKDNNGVIVRVAKGENPIEKLSEFLVADTDESRTTLQEMGNRIGTNFADADKPKEASNDSEKDKEIALLKEQLAKLSEQNNKKEEVVTTTEEESIESLREAFKTKFGKEVAPVMKNNAEWIKAKLNEQNE